MTERVSHHHAQHAATLTEQLRGIWRRRKGLFLMTFVLVFPAGVSLVLALPPLYRTSTLLLLGQGDISTALVAAGSNEGITARLDVINKAILGRQRLQDLIERFNLYPQLRQKQSMQTVVDRMRRDISIKQEAAGQQQQDQNHAVSLILSYQNADPQLAAKVANELAALYGEENENLLQHRNESTTAFLRTQLDEASRKMADQEARIRAFRNKHLGELPEQQSLTLTTLERLTTELRLSGEKQLQLMNRHDAQMAGSNALGMLSGQSGVTRLDLLRGQLAELRNHYTDRHPDVQRLQSEIHALEASESAAPPAADSSDTEAPHRRNPQSDSTSHELIALEQQQVTLRASIRDLQAKLQSTPGVAQELLQLNQEYDTSREQHMILQKRYQDARLAESMEQQQNRRFQVLEPALPPLAPVAPLRSQLIMLSLVLSLAASGGLVMLLEQFDTSFHSLQDLRSFTSVPVLATISRIDTLGNKLRRVLRVTCYTIATTLCAAALALAAHEVGNTRGEPLVLLLAGRSL